MAEQHDIRRWLGQGDLRLEPHTRLRRIAVPFTARFNAGCSSIWDKVPPAPIAYEA
jgi:hypothetical protein